MKKRYELLILLVIAVLTAVLFRDNLSQFFVKKIPQIEKSAEFIIAELKKKISAPAPLRSDKNAPLSFLTKKGIIYWTNLNRSNDGLVPLSENASLNAVAAAKVNDMFARQYFAHESPTGEDAGYLAEVQGYNYILIGENLALGNYANDAELVQAWMNSPGHRKNILNPNYREIGVAFKKGIFEGKSTTLAVQIFGLADSVCPTPDPDLKARIDANQSQLKIWSEELKTRREELERMEPKRGPEYNKKTQEYNDLVEAYNKLLDETQVYIDQYNAQINEANKCRDSFG